MVSNLRCPQSNFPLSTFWQVEETSSGPPNEFPLAHCLLLATRSPFLLALHWVRGGWRRSWRRGRMEKEKGNWVQDLRSRSMGWKSENSANDNLLAPPWLRTFASQETWYSMFVCFQDHNTHAHLLFLPFSPAYFLSFLSHNLSKWTFFRPLLPSSLVASFNVNEA